MANTVIKSGTYVGNHCIIITGSIVALLMCLKNMTKNKYSLKNKDKNQESNFENGRYFKASKIQ